MPAAIDTISPGRGRAGDTQAINGSGFGSYGTNAVRVDDGTGFVVVPGVDITTIDDSTIEFVLPAGLARDRHVVVEVTNNEDNTSAIWWVYSQLTLAELETNRQPIKQPGFRESTVTTAGVPDEDPLVQEAKDWNRLGAKNELAQLDLLTTLGDVAARGDGMRRIPVGTNGQRFFRDSVAGGVWKTLEPEVLWWGGQVAAAQFGIEMVLVPHADATLAAQVYTAAVTNAREQLASNTGHIALVNIHVTEDSTGTNSFINRVRVLVNDVEALDTDDLPFLEQPFLNEVDSYALAAWIPITIGDLIQVLVSKNNAAQTLNVIARAVIV